MTKKFIVRDKIKRKMKEEEERIKCEKKEALRMQKVKWQAKMSSSPFTVNLVADTERLEEEHAIRLEDEQRRRAMVEARSRAAKQEIILRALQEESDLEALRREKRAIMEGERRLKVRVAVAEEGN